MFNLYSWNNNHISETIKSYDMLTAKYGISWSMNVFTCADSQAKSELIVEYRDASSIHDDGQHVLIHNLMVVK